MTQKQSYVGIDIADHTIEVLEMTGSASKPVLSLKNRVQLEPGIIEWGRIKDEEKLKDVFEKLFNISKVKQISRENVIVSLPDSLVYVHIFHLPPHNKKEREKLILKELQSVVPEKLSNVLYSYQIFSEDRDVVKGMLVAVPKDEAQVWFDFFKKNKFNVKMFDTEAVALKRSMFFGQKNEKVCLVDLGAQSTSINIFNKDRFYFCYNTHIAGDYFNREISNKLSISLSEAEQQKIENGLTGKNTDISNILTQGLDKIISDTKNIIEVNDDNEKNIKRILLVGGTSKMSGLLEYLQKHFEIPVEIFSLPKTFKAEELEFVESFGLALRGLAAKDYEDEPIILEKQLTQKNSSALNSLKKEESEYLKNLDEHFDVGGVSPDVNFDRYNPDNKKLSRTVWLLIFMGFSVFLLVAAFVFREINRNNRKEQISTSDSSENVVQYTLQELFLDIPLSVSPNNYTKERIRGRLFTDIILKIDLIENENEEKTLEMSKAKALAQIGENEELYPIAVERLNNKDDYQYKWLVISSKDIKDRTLDKIDSLNNKKIPYLFEELKIESIEKTTNEDLYVVKVLVKVSSNENFKLTN
ncbi:MAG: pilus assembly protein PilM [Candidatus Magasanikbacteria bacterium]